MPLPNRRFLIVGLGRFGGSLARRLARLGHEVIATDIREELVEDIADEVDEALVLDATDERALQGLGIDQVEVAIVALGSEAVEASILCTALLRQLGAREVIARGTSVLHGRILHAVGAHEVINPEEQMSEILSVRLGSPGLLQSFAFGRGFSAAEIRVPLYWVEKDLRQLALRSAGLNVAAVGVVERGGTVTWQPSPDPTRPFRASDVVLVVGADDEIAQLTRGKP